MPETDGPFVYLASQSPRRVELLTQAGIAHRLLPHDPGVDAEALELEQPGESPEAYVARVVQAKLQAARDRCARRGLPAAPVICADTTVALGERIFGKPADADDARRMLSALSGRRHRVITGVAVAQGERQRSVLQTSQVEFEPLDAARIDAYVASGEPFGKAGAYAIQGRAAAFIVRIEGSPSGIMGLPLHETLGLLHAVGWSPLAGAG